MESTDPQYAPANTTINNPTLNLLQLNGFITPKNNVSIHYHIRPNSDNFESVGYFAALKFGGNPYLNNTYQSFDMWDIFCPQTGNYLFFDAFGVIII
jgi:hypothetical protein